MWYRGGDDDGRSHPTTRLQKCIDRSVEDEQTKLIEGLTCGVSVEKYIGADDDEPIECNSDTIEFKAVENDSDSYSAGEVTIVPSEDLECCLRL